MSRLDAYATAIANGFESPSGLRKYGDRPKWIGPWVLDGSTDDTRVWMRRYDDGPDSCWTWKVGPEVPW